MKRLRLFILSFFAVISIAVNASIIASGKCGTNINWSLSDGGSLELTGTGMMTNYSSTTQAPWFSYREKIVKVFINSGITSIGDYAFHYLKNVTSVSIPNSVTSIGYNAFNFCSGLTSLTIPNSVTSIDKHAFWGVNNIVYTGSASGEPWSAKSLNGYVEGYLVFKDNTKRELLGCSNVIKDAFVIPYSVTSVGKYAFANCDQLTSVTIPNSVTSIGDYVFQNCSNLTSVLISYSLKDIGEEIFLACWKLTTLNVDINNPYYSSYDNVLFNKDKTELIYYIAGKKGAYNIPSSVTTIGTWAFEENKNLTSITIPNSVMNIGDYAFHGCSSLTSVTIPNSVTSIGGGAFAYCSSLSSINIPNSVKSIGNGAFSNCNKLPIVYNLRYADTYLVEAIDKTLSSYSIKQGTKWIGSYAFSSCSNLSSITLPNTVTCIEYAAFSSCM